MVEKESLNNLLDELLLIKRFSGLEHILKENVRTHVFSCRLRARMLPLDEEAKEYIYRIIELHDLPEIVTGDLLAYEKSDKDKQAEVQAVEFLGISEMDKKMIYEFNQAKEALAGKTIENKELVPEAVLAAMIDFVDAAENFHINASWWVGSSYYDEKLMPENKALVYALEVYEVYINNLSNLGLSEKYLEILESLLIYILDWIVVHWNQAPEEKIPVAMKEKLAWAGSEMVVWKNKGKDPDNLPGLERFPSLHMF